MNSSTVNDIDIYTGNEIFGQPELWKSIYNLILDQKDTIEEFMQLALSNNDLRIVLTGAGSSAFIGEAAQGIVQSNTGKVTQAIATTDIVTHPELFFLADTPTLLVSFARSGNSPESVETVNLANKYCNNIYHLIITCNKDGELAKYGSSENKNCYSLVLPEASNDKSLAMTGSFTSMLLSAILTSDIKNIESNSQSAEEIIALGNAILNKKELLNEVASQDFERVVFLGSGPLLGVARECHLKLQELTDGQVICKHDSFLGFRHGPRAVVNDNTLIVYLFSDDEHVLKYEKDLATDIAKKTGKILSASLGGPKDLNKNTVIDDSVNNNVLRIVPATLIGQLLGYYKSLQLGLNPDNPSVSGAISRVVQGVNIYKK